MRSMSGLLANYRSTLVFWTHITKFPVVPKYQIHCDVETLLLKHFSNSNISEASDMLCMEHVIGQRLANGKDISGVTSGENCKILCSLWASCQAITWNIQRRRCTVHEKDPRRQFKPVDAHEIHAVKRDDCSESDAIKCVKILALIKESTFLGLIMVFR